MVVVKAKQVPRKKSEPLEVLAMFCYYFPQYTLAQARKLPYKNVKLLLGVAQKQKATEYLHLLSISVAPHTKDGGKSVRKQFKRMAGA